MDTKVTAGNSGSPMDGAFLTRKTPFAPKVFIPCRWSSAKSLNETLIPSQRFQCGQPHSLLQSLQLDVRPAVWRRMGTHSFKNILWLQNQWVLPHSQCPSTCQLITEYLSTCSVPSTGRGMCPCSHCMLPDHVLAEQLAGAGVAMRCAPRAELGRKVLAPGPQGVGRSKPWWCFPSKALLPQPKSPGLSMAWD